MVTAGCVLRGNSLIEKTLGFFPRNDGDRTNPSSLNFICSHRQAAKSSLFHGEVSSSNLLGSASQLRVICETPISAMRYKL